MKKKSDRDPGQLIKHNFEIETRSQQVTDGDRRRFLRQSPEKESQAESSGCGRNPTEHFTVFVPQVPLIDECYVAQKGRSMDFKAHKL